jgi:hypothetical protein
VPTQIGDTGCTVKVGVGNALTVTADEEVAAVAVQPFELV